MPPATHRIAIHKFGGAALADAAAIRHVGALLTEPAEERRVAVTSALQGVTDSLLRALHCATEGDASGAHTIEREITERHTSVASALEARRQTVAAAPIRSVIATPVGARPLVDGGSAWGTSRTRNAGRSGKARLSSGMETL